MCLKLSFQCERCSCVQSVIERERECVQSTKNFSGHIEQNSFLFYMHCSPGFCYKALRIYTSYECASSSYYSGGGLTTKFMLHHVKSYNNDTMVCILLFNCIPLARWLQNTHASTPSSVTPIAVASSRLTWEGSDLVAIIDKIM